MNINEFYSFGSKLHSSTLQAHPVGLGVDECGVSDHLNLISGKYHVSDKPIVFKQAYGNKLTDILDTGFASLYLISERVKDILEQEGFSGWKTFPIRLMDKKGNEITGHYGLSITGVCGAIDYNKSDVLEKSKVPGGRLCKYFKGLFVGFERWDGSDFFIPEGTSHIIVSKKVAAILRKNKITNLDLENLEEMEISYSPEKLQ